MRIEPERIEYLYSQPLPVECAWGRGFTFVPAGQVSSGPALACIGSNRKFTVVSTPDAETRPDFIDSWDFMHPDPLPGEPDVQPWDLHFDAEADQIWWTFAPWYVNIQENHPFLGWSTTSPVNPNPSNLYGWGSSWVGSGYKNPLHAAKMHSALFSIPAVDAEYFFNHPEGEYLLGHGNGLYQGPRGGSQGPSIYLRDPSKPISVGEPVPGCWYEYALNSYVNEWQHMHEMGLNGSGEAGIRSLTKSGARSIEFISAPDDEDPDLRHGAFLMTWVHPVIDMNMYPHNEPGAENEVGVQYWGNPDVADPDEYPAAWYGFPKYDPTQPPEWIQQPSWCEKTAQGRRLEGDSRLMADDPQNGSPGPRVQKRQSGFILYEADPVHEVTQGGLEHDEPQPYAFIPFPDHIPNVSLFTGGMAYDRGLQEIYVFTSGPNPHVHVWSLDGAGSPPPPPPPPPPTQSPKLTQVPAFRIDGLPIGEEVEIIAGHVETQSGIEWQGVTVNVRRHRKPAPIYLGSATVDQQESAYYTMEHGARRPFFVQAVHIPTETVSEVVKVEPFGGEEPPPTE